MGVAVGGTGVAVGGGGGGGDVSVIPSFTHDGPDPPPLINATPAIGVPGVVTGSVASGVGVVVGGCVGVDIAFGMSLGVAVGIGVGDGRPHETLKVANSRSPPPQKTS